MIWVRWQRWAAPSAALQAVAADDVAFGGDQIAGGQQPGRRRLPAQLDDLAGELVTDDDRRLEAAAGPAVPLPDVEVGAADAGMVDADEHVARSAGGDGQLPQDHAGAGAFLDESAHDDPGVGAGGEYSAPPPSGRWIVRARKYKHPRTRDPGAFSAWPARGRKRA